jgi:hypothetical protein
MAPTFAITTDATKRELRLSREARAIPINQAAWLPRGRVREQAWSASSWC